MHVFLKIGNRLTAIEVSAEDKLLTLMEKIFIELEKQGTCPPHKDSRDCPRRFRVSSSSSNTTHLLQSPELGKTLAELNIKNADIIQIVDNSNQLLTEEKTLSTVKTYLSRSDLLYYAASSGDSKASARLIDRIGPGTDENGNGRLHLLARANLLTDKELQEHKTKINSKNPATDNGGMRVGEGSGNSPLHIAAFYGSVDAVRLLLEHKAKLHEINAAGATALHLAAKGGHVEIMRMLLDAKLDINAKDKMGRTPLHSIMRAYEITQEHAEVVKLLCYRGADVNVQDSSDTGPRPVRKTPIISCCQRLSEGKAQLNALKNILQELIKADADVNHQDSDGNTALHYAVDAYRYKLCYFAMHQLIVAGANINLLNNKKETALDMGPQGLQRDVALDKLFLDTAINRGVPFNSLHRAVSDQKNTYLVPLTEELQQDLKAELNTQLSLNSSNSPVKIPAAVVNIIIGYASLSQLYHTMVQRLATISPLLTEDQKKVNFTVPQKILKSLTDIFSFTSLNQNTQDLIKEWGRTTLELEEFQKDVSSIAQSRAVALVTPLMGEFKTRFKLLPAKDSDASFIQNIHTALLKSGIVRKSEVNEFVKQKILHSLKEPEMEEHPQKLLDDKKRDLCDETKQKRKQPDSAPASSEPPSLEPLPTPK